MHGPVHISVNIDQTSIPSNIHVHVPPQGSAVVVLVLVLDVVDEVDVDVVEVVDVEVVDVEVVVVLVVVVEVLVVVTGGGGGSPSRTHAIRLTAPVEQAPLPAPEQANEAQVSFDPQAPTNCVEPSCDQIVTPPSGDENKQPQPPISSQYG